MLQAGIVGLPNVGKSTLFNALTAQEAALAANYPFATIEPNVGVVAVPDERLAPLAKIVKTDVIVPATVEFVDIAGLVRGASKGEGLGNQFLANIRETDAVIQVVRCFEDDNIVHVEGSVDPVRDIETIQIELALADLASAENAEVVPICASLEAQLVALDPSERSEYLRDLGLASSGVDRLIKSAYKMLGLMSFLTAGEKEVRAWTIPIGTKAPKAAGVIHSDIERGFIRAEIVSYDDLTRVGSYAAARDQGLLRLEGKEYVMQEGDI